MKLTKIIVLALMPLVFASCESLLPVPQPVKIKRNAPLDQYTYFYITPTEAKTGSSGFGYYLGSGVYLNSPNRTTNPADIITGYLINKGLVRVPEIKDELSDKTMIINYGETGRRRTDHGYSSEVTLQFVSAKTNEVICVIIAEGRGASEVDDIRIAINRCLEEMYKQ